MALWLIALLVLVLAAVLVGFGWVMSNHYLVPAPYSLQAEFELGDVDAVPGGTFLVELPLVREPTQFAEVGKEGVYGLLWEGGYGQLGEVVEARRGSIVRRLHSVVGRPPSEGAPARLDTTIYRRDPLADHGIPFEDLELQGPAGKLKAWWMDRGTDRAVLALHGRRRADRTETLRLTPVPWECGWSVLSLAYRNHDASDMSPDGFYHYGHSEADDALVALAELRSRGIREVVLCGFSMGGSVALEAVRRWPEDGPRLAGIILDSPLLDMREVIRQGATRFRPPIPRPLVDISLFVGRLRAGTDWRELDHRRLAPRLDVPVLLIAGTRDATIPITLVDEFARQVASPLTYLRLDGVEHVEGWNARRHEYEEAVERFLAGVAEGK